MTYALPVFLPLIGINITMRKASQHSRSLMAVFSSRHPPNWFCTGHPCHKDSHEISRFQSTGNNFPGKITPLPRQVWMNFLPQLKCLMHGVNRGCHFIGYALFLWYISFYNNNRNALNLRGWSVRLKTPCNMWSADRNITWVPIVYRQVTKTQPNSGIISVP